MFNAIALFLNNHIAEKLKYHLETLDSGQCLTLEINLIQSEPNTWVLSIGWMLLWI